MNTHPPSARSLAECIATTPSRIWAMLPFVLLSLSAGAQDTIVIHPPLAPDLTAEKEWSTYVGGLGDDQVLSVATDAFGHVYVAGRTSDSLRLSNDTTGRSGTTFQGAFGGGASDAFLAKYAPNGPMLWATYFGGDGDDEAVQVVVVDMDGVYLVGNTTSASGIASDTLALQSDHGGGNDLFIARFNEYGELLGATYFGGPDDEYATGAALDHAGYLLVAGFANGPGATGPDPVQPYTGGEDGLLLRYAGTDQLLAATFIGGDGDDRVVQVAPGDSTGLVLVGNTNSASGLATADAMTPALQGGTDAFLMKLDTALQVLYGTYFGGPGDDLAQGLARSTSGWALCGSTTSASLFTTPDVHQPANLGNGEGFIAVLDADMGLAWSSFFGDTAADRATAVFYDDEDNLYVAGITASPIGIATATGTGSYLQGSTDAFVLRFDSASSELAWSRYAGAMGEDEAHALTVMGHTSVIIGGRTNSTDGLTFRGHQMEYGGGDQDGAVQRMDQVRSSPAGGICTTTGGGGGGGGGGGSYSGVTKPLNYFPVCLGDSVTFIVYGGALGVQAVWMWYADECGEPEQFITMGDTITIAPTESFVLYVRAENAAMVTRCAELPIEVFLPPEDPQVLVPDTVCPGMPFQVLGSGADDFTWRLVGSDTMVAGDTAVMVAPLEPGMHLIMADAINGSVCHRPIEDSIRVMPKPAPVWQIAHVSCHGAGDGQILLDSLLADGRPSEGLVADWGEQDLEGVALTGLQPGTYVVGYMDVFGCSGADTLYLFEPAPLISTINTTPSFCSDPLGTAELFTESMAPGLLFDWGLGPDTLLQATGLLPGQHTVVATDSTGCTLSLTFDIGGNALPQPVITGPDTVCAGEPVVLSATGADQFTWQVADIVFQGDSAAFLAPFLGDALVITLTAVNGNECTVEWTHTIHVRPLPMLSWDVQDPSCAGSSDGSITLWAGEGDELLLTWEPEGLEGPALTGLAPGEYAATVTDANGCTHVDILTITAPPPLMDSVSVAGTFCDKEIGAAQVHTHNTSPGLAFDWGDGPGAAMAVDDLAAGHYNVVATNDAGCQQLLGFTIVAWGQISVSVLADTIVAQGGQTLLQAVATPLDSVDAYLWTPATGLVDPTAPTTVCYVFDTITYVVQATSLAGCTALDSVVVIPDRSQPPALAGCGQVFIPDLFSPNSDGLNDELCVMGGCFEQLALHIYNRSGSLVYATTEVEACWDGTAHGASAPAGSYLFTLAGARSNGEVVERSGIITLKR